MSRSTNQKLKLLYIRDWLVRETDADHKLTVADLIQKLEQVDISAERKSIYDDIEVLRDLYGLDIQQDAPRGRPAAYYTTDRTFELPELKLLVDAVQSFKFISEKKTRDLIKKIETLCSAEEAKELNREVHTADRVKNRNEGGYNSVDAIHRAINGNHPISFKYFQYKPDKTRLYHNNGELYHVSPYALIWDSENYYLVGYHHEKAAIRHYRVDRMERVQVLESRLREGAAEYAAQNTGSYTKKHFSMFSGQEVTVKLRFDNNLANAVLDRLGHDAFLVPDGDYRFTVTTPVVVSGPFFAWMFEFGGQAEILAPANIRASMRHYIEDVRSLYEDD